MPIKEYDREAAAAYARRWAFGRNPRYYDFSSLGGDCTNFASQCVLAGGGVMNFTPVYGWFYRGANDRSASWAGVDFFDKFIVGNEGAGPVAEETDLGAALPGDVVQLGNADGVFYHSPVVTGISRGRVLVAAHSFDAYDRPLDTYGFDRVRCLHITGVRV